MVMGLARSTWNHRLVAGLAIGAGAAGNALCYYGGPLLAAGWPALSSTGALVLARMLGLWDQLWRPASIMA